MDKEQTGLKEKSAKPNWSCNTSCVLSVCSPGLPLLVYATWLWGVDTAHILLLLWPAYA